MINSLLVELTDDYNNVIDSCLFKVEKRLDDDSLKEPCKWIFGFKRPCHVKITDSDENVLEIDIIRKCGCYNKKGEKEDNLHFDNGYNNIPFENSNLKEREMRCINEFGNNYKKYYIIPDGHLIQCQYGSIDVPREDCRYVKNPYQRWQYWFLYYEKLSKGYKDVTTAFKDGVVRNIETSDEVDINGTPETDNEKLYALLMSYAKGVVSRTLVSQVVTKVQVTRARRYFEAMCKAKTVKGFNTQLMNLMVLSPRKRDWMAGDKVSQYLAAAKEDFPRIIEFEENLLLSMEAIAFDKPEVLKDKKIKKSNCPHFENINIRLATKDEIDMVKDYLKPNQANLVQQVYKIEPIEQNYKFENYVKSHGLKEKDIKYLWHGSVNGNWASIVQKSLIINPSAANGRMFGDGIYFAPSSQKSWGYTSYRGTYWANGNDNTAIMGLYKTAYGKPYHPQNHYYGTDYKKETLNGYNCLHAEAHSCGLQNDEIIFYNTDQVCLEYLVVFH